MRDTVCNLTISGSHQPFPAALLGGSEEVPYPQIEARTKLDPSRQVHTVCTMIHHLLRHRNSEGPHNTTTSNTVLGPGPPFDQPWLTVWELELVEPSHVCKLLDASLIAS